MSEHTPGPWTWSYKYKSRDGSDTWSLIGVDGYGILSCDGESNSPQSCNKADALLIAAAPELLESLKLAKLCIEAMIEDGRCGETFVGAALTLDKINFAIAKAEGKQ